MFLSRDSTCTRYGGQITEEYLLFLYESIYSNLVSILEVGEEAFDSTVI